MPKIFKNDTAVQTPIAAKNPKVTAQNTKATTALISFLKKSILIKPFPHNILGYPLGYPLFPRQRFTMIPENPKKSTNIS